MTNQETYSLQVQQNYSKGHVELSLFSPFVHEAGKGHVVYNTKNIPTTSSKKKKFIEATQ